MSRSIVRILDIGGLVWESERPYPTVAEALADAEEALADWPGEKRLVRVEGSLVISGQTAL